MGEFGNPSPGDRLGRDALHLKTALDVHEVIRAHLEQPAGQSSALVPDVRSSLREGAPAQSCAAAAEGADCLRSPQGVAVAHDHVLEGDPELIRDDLGEGGLVALTVRTRASDGGDLPAPLHAYDSALPTLHIRRLDVGGHPDAHELATGAGRGLGAAQPGVVRQFYDA